MSTADFLRDLLAHNMTVLASRSGKLELLFYSDRPRHPDTDAMKARFHALTDGERAALCDYVADLPR